MKTNLDFNYSFQIDSSPNGILFGAKSAKCNHNPNSVETDLCEIFPLQPDCEILHPLSERQASLSIMGPP